MIDKILQIVYSSQRPMPAHFTGSDTRNQTFLIDFDISEDDEYEMASQAWYLATSRDVIKIGEDLMLSSYIAIKLGGEKYIADIQKIILSDAAPYYIDIDLDKHKDYFEDCINFGKIRASK